MSDSINRAYTPEQQRQISAEWYEFQPPKPCDICGGPCGDQALCDRCLRACEWCDKRDDLIEW